MTAKPSRKRIVLATLLAIVCLTGWVAVDRILLVGSLQNALNRDWEIEYNDGRLLLSDEVDSSLHEFLYKLVPEPEHRFFGEKKNRAGVWHDRLVSLLYGRITRLEVYYPEVLRADLGVALSRFSSLQELEIYEPDFSKEDWIYIFRGLKKLARLEKLVIHEPDTR